VLVLVTDLLLQEVVAQGAFGQSQFSSDTVSHFQETMMLTSGDALRAWISESITGNCTPESDEVAALFKTESGRHIRLIRQIKGTGIVDDDLQSRAGFQFWRFTGKSHIAGNMNGIVVGTGNKVEDFGVGFYTKYGDGGVDISPIADLYKTEVRELGRYLGIPQDIINATPTDGLWDDDRNDEEQIGATYEELEWVMEYGINKQVYTKKEFNILEIYQNFNNKNNHKMIQIPIFDLKENEII
jgi:NAD+ synthetase